MVIQEAMEYLQRNAVPHVTDEMEALADDQFIVGKAGGAWCVSMHLLLSEQMQLLKKGLDGLNQRAFILALRHHFQDSMVDDGILPMLRQLKFVSNTNGQSDIKTGRESMGLDIQKRVSGIDMDRDLPDDIGLNVPVYRTLRRATVDGAGDFFRVPVVCTFDVNVDKGEFTLKPKPGELERAVVQANAAVATEIREAITAMGLGRSDEELPKVIDGSTYRVM